MGYDVVFITVQVTLECQPILARTVYTQLEDHCLYFGSEGGEVAYLKGGNFFSSSYVGQFNENYCLSLQALSRFQRQLFPLRSVGNGRWSALPQIICHIYIKNSLPKLKISC